MQVESRSITGSMAPCATPAGLRRMGPGRSRSDPRQGLWDGNGSAKSPCRCAHGSIAGRSEQLAVDALRSAMKKTFQLHIAGKNPDRVLDAVRHEVRKYVRRERRRALPAGADYWQFDCKFGLSPESAGPAHLSALTDSIDRAAKDGSARFYVEILAKPGHRKARTEDVSNT